MSAYTQELEREQRNKRRSRRFAIIFHVAILGLALFPFLNAGSPEPEYETVVTIDFTDFEKQASKKSADRAKGKIKKPVKKPAPVRAKEPKPKPKPQAAPARKPVVTTPEPAPKIETSPTPKKEKSKVVKPVPAPAPVEVPEEIVEDPVPADPVPTPAETTESTPNAGAPDATAVTGNGAGAGKDADGHADKDNNGTAAEGNNGLDFSGDGLLTRPVIYRADVKKITREEGKIVVNICVAQSGRVIYAKFNREDSTIKTTSLIREAIDTAKDYRFERDYTLPKKQCGKLTFIFEIEEE